jgi:repressor LexA
MAPRKKPLPLTLKELKVLEFIEQVMLDQSTVPTYQEIREHFGFASLNSVQRYLKQLQDKNYIYIPGGNQKRAMQVLHSSKSISNLLSDQISDSAALSTNQIPNTLTFKKEAPLLSSSPPLSESLSLPLLGRVAAGLPIESFTHDEYVEVPSNLIRNPNKTFALSVQGQSMIEDGILDGDLIFVQKQTFANNGDTVVAMVNNQATVKRFYLHSRLPGDFHINPQSDTQPVPGAKAVELRPANSTMDSMWYRPDLVDIQGVLVGLMRRF